MIKKVICPADFSSAANNAIEYAAKLAQKTEAALTLLHVQPMYIGEGVSLFSGGERESVKEANVAAKLLDDVCLDINKLFKISCTREIIPSMGSFEKVVEDESEKFDLTVIGTNGADNVFQYYFGSHSFRIARKTKTPVLIIPEEYSYCEIKNVVFASDYTRGDDLQLEQLKQFTDVFNPAVHVIHIKEKGMVISQEVFDTFCKIAREGLNYINDITFETLVNENEEGTIENFVKRTQSDLLALYVNEHGFLHSLFHNALAERITFDVNYPVLIFHK